MKESAAYPSNGMRDAELELVRGCQSGDPASLETLVRSHVRMVLSVAARFAKDFSEAEDLCQEILVKAVRGVRAFRGESTIRTWVYSMAVAHCIDHVRRNTAIQGPIEDAGSIAAPTAGCPDFLFLSAERAAAVHVAVDSLPEDLKTVVLLYDFDGLPQKEIADRMGIPEGTVWSKLHRARTILRSKLSHLLRG